MTESKISRSVTQIWIKLGANDCNFVYDEFRNDYYQKLGDLFRELSETENLIQNTRAGTDCSVLKVGCVEVDNWQVSENDGVDSDSKNLSMHV